MKTKFAQDLRVGDVFIDPQTEGVRRVTVVGGCFKNRVGEIHPAGQYASVDLLDPVEGQRTASYERQTQLTMC